MNEIRCIFNDELFHIIDECQQYIPKNLITEILSVDCFEKEYLHKIIHNLLHDSSSDDGCVLNMWLVKHENIFEKLMILCGSHDPKIARKHSPNCIRAKYGIDEVQNVLFYTKTHQSYKIATKYLTFNEHASSDGTASVSLSKHTSNHTQNNAYISQQSGQQTVVIIKPHIQGKQIYEIISLIENAGFIITQDRSTFLPLESWLHFMQKESPDDKYVLSSAEHMCSSAVIALVVKSKNVFHDFKELVGSSDPVIARLYFPHSIRAKYGIDQVRNAVWFAKNEEIYKKVFDQFFFTKLLIVNSNTLSSAVNDDIIDAIAIPSKIMRDDEQTIVILKPHVRNSQIEDILNMIKNAGIFIVEKKTAFLTYDSWMKLLSIDTFDSSTSAGIEHIRNSAQYLASAPVTALIVEGLDIYECIKEIAGNEDPTVAKFYFPQSIRALFGINLMKNVIWWARTQHIFNIARETFFAQAQLLSSTVSKHAYAYSDTLSFLDNESGNTLKINSVWNKAIVVIKPHIKGKTIDDIISVFTDAGFSIIQEKTHFLPFEAWLYVMKYDSPDVEYLKKCAMHLSSGAITALNIEHNNIFDVLLDIGGSEEPSIAQKHYPDSIRAKFGIDGIRNAIWWTKNVKVYGKSFSKFFFEEKAVANEINSDEIMFQNNEQYTNGNKTYVYIHVQPCKYVQCMHVCCIYRGMKCLVIVKPYFVENVDKIFQILDENNIIILQQKAIFLPNVAIHSMLEYLQLEESLHELFIHDMSNDESIIIQVEDGSATNSNIFEKIINIVGFYGSNNKNTLRSLYAASALRNCVIITENEQQYNILFDHLCLEDESSSHSASIFSVRTTKSYSNPQSFVSTSVLLQYYGVMSIYSHVQ